MFKDGKFVIKLVLVKDKKGIIRCKYCGKAIEEINNLEEHIKQHEGE